MYKKYFNIKKISFFKSYFFCYIYIFLLFILMFWYFVYYHQGIQIANENIICFLTSYLLEILLSIDNVFAAVAFTPNIILVCAGVFIGILAMRFIANYFVKMMAKYTFLETAAFIVIAVLGIKLTLSLVEHFQPESGFAKFMKSETADVIMSVITVSIFFIPILTSRFFNFPKKH